MPAVHISKIKAVFIHLPKCAGTSVRDGLFAGACSMPVEGWQPLPSNWPIERSFAIIREPVDRFISAITWLGITAAEGLRSLADESIAPAPNRRSPEKLAKYHLLPQCDEHNRLYRAAHVLRFEHLQSDFDALAYQLGFEPQALPQCNAAPADPVTLTTEEHAQVVELYRRDFTQLDYPLPE